MSAFEQMSDEEIIAAYRRGEESAIDFICQKYKPLVLKRAKAMFLAGGETDEMCIRYSSTRDSDFQQKLLDEYGLKV